jgi:hypothetical protein
VRGWANGFGGFTLISGMGSAARARKHRKNTGCNPALSLERFLLMQNLHLRFGFFQRLNIGGRAVCW